MLYISSRRQKGKRCVLLCWLTPKENEKEEEAVAEASGEEGDIRYAS